MKKSITLILFLSLIAVLVAACGGTTETVEVTRVVTETVTETVEVAGDTETVTEVVEVTRVVTEVETVIEEVIIDPNAEEEANRISRRACIRGDAVHKLVEKYIQNEELIPKDFLPHVWHAFTTIRPIIESRLNNIALSESPLFSDHLQLAGRVDLVAEFDGVLSIVDIKTSRRIKEKADIDNYFLQEAAYAIMFEERTGIPITNLVTIMVIDENEPRVFKEHRDNWTEELIKTIREYNQRKLFGN